MTGPVGCGKTTSLHALANDLGFCILEWTNPVTGGHIEEGKEQLTREIRVCCSALNWVCGRR